MRPLSIAALLLAAFAACAAAPPSEAANWANLNSLAPGSKIRVSLADGRSVRGFLQQVTPDTLSINAAQGQEALARQDVKRVQVKGRSHRGRNTLIGLAIGAAGGLAAGAAFDSRDPGDWFPNLGKVALTPLGAIIGTVVGVAMPTGRWRQVYRAA